MEAEEEKSLIKALQSKKDKDVAFSKLVKLYSQKLYWHIRHIVKNHDDTDDVLQNVFIKVFNNIHKFNQKSKLYSWLYRIATNESITFINQKAKKLKINSEEINNYLIENIEADPYFDGDLAQLKLQKAIATLPQKQQLIFNMKYFEELKYREISEILETSEGALKASYHIAVKKIEHFLKTN